MAKLSEPQEKALRYLLAVEFTGSAVSPEIFYVFENYSPKGRTLDSLVKRGLITEITLDEFGMAKEPHKLTRTGYIAISYELSDVTKEERAFSTKRLNEINDATREQSAKNREIKARAELIAQARYGVGYSVEQAREIEKQLRREEAVIVSATPIEEVPGTEVHEAIEALADVIVSGITGLSVDEIKAQTGREVSGADDGIRSFDSFADLLRSLDLLEEHVNLPALPEPRCGNVLFEEIECTRDPNHEGAQHGYSPGYGLEELTWDDETRRAFDFASPEMRAHAVDHIRSGRDAAIRAKEAELEAIASGSTWPANCTERARTAHKIAQEVCELNGFDPDDVLHVHDGGDHVQICTALPPSKSVERFALAAGQRIGMELKWAEGLVSSQIAPSTGCVGIIVQEHAHP